MIRLPRDNGMSKLNNLIGKECKLDALGWALREAVDTLSPGVVGACLLHCSDETERESAEAFQRWFVGAMLPDLKPSFRAAFRTANLGARYERGAVHIAEEHFPAPNAGGGPKVLVVKVSSHVGVCDTDAGLEFGFLVRYGRRSACCGALAGLVAGAELPAVRELARTFASDGRGRLEMLRDAAHVKPEERALLAAIANARLQAGQVVADIEAHAPHEPTIFLVVPCVTINRSGADTEIIVGWYEVDRREGAAKIDYAGLGDDPTAYRVRQESGRIVVDERAGHANSKPA